jgi:uncharacterized protein (TIGR02118 family)
MAKLVVLYNPPADPAAFDEYYEARHVPIAKLVPGLRDVHVSTGPVMTPAGPAPYHRVAMLGFDSVSALQAGFSSTQGQAAVADLANFASGGATMLIFEDKAL